MKITIGEILNIVIPFSNNLEVSEAYGSPFMTASISNASGFRKFFIYVKQTADHEYAVCDSIDNNNGNRYYVSKSNEKPFIMERDVIRQQLGSGPPDPNWYDTVRVGLNKEAFTNHFIDLLIQYDVIRFRRESESIILEDMGIRSDKIKRAIKKAFKDHSYVKGSIQNLLDIVYFKGDRFWMRGCGLKEMQVVSSKLRTIGLLSTIEHDFITSIQFDKR